MERLRRRLPAQEALTTANFNLEVARNTLNQKLALEYCKAAKKELGRINDPTSSTYLNQIIAAYRKHGGLVEKYGSLDKAKKSHNKADKLEQNILGVAGCSSSPSLPRVRSTSQSVLASPLNTVITGDSLGIIPSFIFAKDFQPQLYKCALPEPDDDLTDTRQLAYCLALLQASPSHRDFLDEPTRTWLQNTMESEDEQERLKAMATDILLEFKLDGLKDDKATAEIACIAPFLEKNNFRSLLGIFVDSLKDSSLFSVHALEGLDSVIKCATPGSVDPNDLIKILEHVNLYLQGTCGRSLDHVYRLTRTVSHILDAMVDGNNKDLDRVKLHTPLLLYSKELQKSADPYMVFQAAYAFQALLRVPNEEQRRQTTLRYTWRVLKGTAELCGAVKNFNFGEIIDTARGGLEVTIQILRRVGSAYQDFSALKESGQDLREALRASFTRKRAWYPILRGIDALLQNGELTKVKAMVCDAPCRRELAFQWGVCQRLGNIAADPIWDTDSQEGAVAFLGEIYRNDAIWGQETKVKQCILDIMMQLASTSGGAKHAANSLLQEFAKDVDPEKRALYDACRKEGPSSHLWRVALPSLSSSPLLDRVQKTPVIDAGLRNLARVRLEDLGDTIYIAPEAKSHRQAADNDLFDLMTKAKEFLDSDKKVLLIWGDSGAGKSTFNKELERELWNGYMNCKDQNLRKQKTIPIFVSLSTIDKSENNFVGRQLHEADFSKTQIKELKAKHKFVLICDGYDEYQQNRNLYNFNQLNRPGQWKAQMVISCRSEYLGHDYCSLFQPEGNNSHICETLLQEAVIAPFSKERIEAYIEKYVAKEAPQWKVMEVSQREIKGASKWEVKDYIRAFDQIPSLQELVTNPFLLTLSLRVLPNMADLGKNMPSIKVTRIMLYDQLLDQWIEQGKRRLISRELVGEYKRAFDALFDDDFSKNAILFVTQLAVAIFKNQNGNPVVEYSHNRGKGTWKADFFGQDECRKLLREACPIHRDGNMHEFIHQSVLEYGVARAVFEPRQRGYYKTRGQDTFAAERKRCEHQGAEKDMTAPNDDSPLFCRSFVDKPAVLQFLAERVLQEPVFEQQLHDFIENSKTDERWRIAASNAITILIRAGVRFNRKDLKGIRIPGADLSGGQFDSSQLQGADLRNANLRNSWLRQANLSNTQMSGVQFGELPYLQEDSEVNFCSYSPNGRTCAVGLHNGMINLYDTETWIEFLSLSGHTDNVLSVTYSPSGHQIASGGRDKTIRLWDTQTGTPSLILDGHTKEVTSVIYSPSGQQIASGGRDKTVRLWDAKTGALMLTLEGHTHIITSVTYSPSGLQIASGAYDGTVRLWDAQTGTLSSTLSGHIDYVTSVTYSPDGLQIASGSWDKTLRLWDSQTGVPGLVLRGHTGRIYSVVYSPNGHQIATGGRDNTVRIWNAQTGAPGPILSGHTASVSCIAYSPCGAQIASGSYDRTVRLWDAQTSVVSPTLSGHVFSVNSLTYSPNGHQIALGNGDKTVQLWDAQTGASGLVLSGHGDLIYSVIYSPSGLQIASGSLDETVRLWDAQTGAPGPILRGHTGCINSVTYSPSGHQIASGGEDKAVRLWDSQTGAPSFTMSGHTGFIYSVTYSPSGHQIASGSKDKTVRLWDVQTGTSSVILEGHTSCIKSVTYSPSGRQIASGSKDNKVRLWDAHTGAIDKVLRGHTNIVTSVAYLPGGHHIASGSRDRTVRLWDVSSGQCLEVIKDGAVSSIAWNVTLDDGVYLTTGCDSCVSTWKVVKEEDQYRARLHWRSTSDRLSVSNASIQNAHGLSRVNTQLLRQRGAVGVPNSTSGLCKLD